MHSLSPGQRRLGCLFMRFLLEGRVASILP